MVLLLFSCKNTCHPGGRCVLATPHHAHQGFPGVSTCSNLWLFAVIHPRNLLGQDRPSAVEPWSCGSQVRVGELRSSWGLWTLVTNRHLFVQTSVHQKWLCLPGPGVAELVMGTGRNLEWSTRGPSIALAKGNQLLKMLGENLDTSLTIFLTSAANSDMVVQSTGGTHKRRKPPSAN